MAEPYFTRLSQIVSQLRPLSADDVTLETKHFFSGAALYANGNICASLSPSGFALKLPESTRLNLLGEGKGSEFRFFPNGPVKKEYVALSPSTLEDEGIFYELIELSVGYVAGFLDSSASTKKEGAIMSKTSNYPPQDKVNLYDQLIATNPDIERKGKTSPYTSHNGHMFTHLSKTGSLGLRLPKEEREAFLEKYNTTLYESYGAIMKEYVTVPDDLLENTEELKVYLDLSYEYIKTLKPKPTKKKS